MQRDSVSADAKKIQGAIENWQFISLDTGPDKLTAEAIFLDIFRDTNFTRAGMFLAASGSLTKAATQSMYFAENQAILGALKELVEEIMKKAEVKLPCFATSTTAGGGSLRSTSAGAWNNISTGTVTVFGRRMRLQQLRCMFICYFHLCGCNRS
jgi:hypothetical protein